MARTPKIGTVVKWLGHTEARTRLASAAAAGRAAHAYLISGPEGIGKGAVAIEFARVLLCDIAKETPCGKCPQCLALRSLQHPDLHLIAPSGSPKDSDTPGSETYPAEMTRLKELLSADPYVEADLAELSASTGKSAKRKLSTGSKIRVADSRQLLYDAYRKPFQARQSVFVILNADQMLREAQNALLKLLEEPPVSATLLLTASNLQAILPTVRSRCQPVKLQGYTPVEIRRALSDAGIEARATELSAALSGGNVRRAIRFATMQAETLEQAAVEFLATSAVMAPEKVQEHVDGLLEDPDFVDDAFFELLMLFLSDAAHARHKRRSNHPRRCPCGAASAAYPRADFQQAIAAVTAASQRAAGYTPTLVLTAMAIELHRALDHAHESLT
ncbi:MAG: DNA polymerase III subunit [Calditrichaeota bacterium]|nr:DNA polymerase III subunit [Calditrichota bacterium]